MERDCDEPVFVCLLIGNAESCAWHRDHEDISSHLDSHLLSSNEVKQSHRGALGDVYDSPIRRGGTRDSRQDPTIAYPLSKNPVSCWSLAKHHSRLVRVEAAEFCYVLEADLT
jgi:hypothetical protein